MAVFWTIFFGIACIFLSIVAIYYKFKKKNRGKSYPAVAAYSAIVAMVTAYLTLFAINWPWALVCFVLRRTPERLSEIFSPNIFVIFGGGAVVLVSCTIVYYLAKREISNVDLPLNASAQEIYEFGRDLTLGRLVWAHLKYIKAGRNDRPLTTLGRDPFSLPGLPERIEWQHLAADLLVQLEPNLVRDSFVTLRERRFFTLKYLDPLDLSINEQWIVAAADEFDDIDKFLDDFDGQFYGSSSESSKFVICSALSEIFDKIVCSPKGLPIRILSQGAILNKMLDFSRYARSLLRRFEHSLIPGTDYTLSSCFVPPTVQVINPSQNIKQQLNNGTQENLLEKIRDWAERPGVDHLSIIGEFGQGKSTALLAYCASWAHDYLDGKRNGRIPLLIELRGKSPRRQSPDRFLAEWGDRFNLQGDALWSLIRSGKIIVIFEGFDEVQDAGLRLDRFEQFSALWRFSYPNAKLIFTGRPNFFLDTDERERLLRSSQAARDAGLENTELLSLSFLDLDGIERVLSKVSESVRQEILAACTSDKAFFDIAKRPSMLPVIGNQWETIRLSLMENGGITSAAIIRHFIDYLYKRKTADLERLGQYQLLTDEVRHFFTQCVANKMVELNSRNTITRSDFHLAIEFGYRNLDVRFRDGDGADYESASSIRRLRAYFENRAEEELLASIATDVRSSGLFVEDPAAGRENYCFPHKQYFEFVLGEIVCYDLEPSDLKRRGANSIFAQFNVIISVEPVSLFFASGLISEKNLKKNFIYKPLNVFIGFISTMSAIVNLNIMKILNRYYKSFSYDDVDMTLFCNVPVELVGECLLPGVARRSMFIPLTITPFFLAQMYIFNVGLFRIDRGSRIQNLKNSYHGRLDILKYAHSELFFMVVSIVLMAFLMIVVSIAMRKSVVSINRKLCISIMSVYRFGKVEWIYDRYGERAHAAFLMMLSKQVPFGAVKFDASLRRNAMSVLTGEDSNNSNESASLAAEP